MKAIKSIVIFLLAALLLFYALIWWEENRVVTVDFVPTYDKTEELESLHDKAITKGLTKEEAERYEWLRSDEKEQVDAQFEQYLEEQKK